VSSWVKYHFRHLANWRKYAEAIAESVKEIIGEEAEVYVIGGIAENRVTVLSDIDILVVIPDNLDPRGLSVKILVNAMDKHGLPWDAPVELHIVRRSEAKQYLSCSKHIRIL